MRGKEKGHVLILGIFLLLVMVAALGYVYEMGRVVFAKIQAQNATDAAARAAQVEMTNLRNIATTHYALADMWMNMARRASQAEYILYYLGLWTSYAADDFFPRGFYGSRKSGSALWHNILAALNAGYHFFYHIQDGAVTRFLTTYEAKRYYSWWLMRDASANDLDRLTDVQGTSYSLRIEFANSIQNAITQFQSALPSQVQSYVANFLPQDTPNYAWRKERMRQAAILASLYNLLDPYEGGPVLAIPVGNSLVSTLQNVVTGGFGMLWNQATSLFTWITGDLVNLLTNPSPSIVNDLIASLPGVDAYSPVIGVAFPSYGVEGKSGIGRNFGLDLKNNALGSTYAKGIFLMPGPSVGRNLLFLFPPFTGPTPALPGGGLGGSVLNAIGNLSSILPTSLIPPGVLQAIPYPILTRAAATSRPVSPGEYHVWDVVADLLSLLVPTHAGDFQNFAQRLQQIDQIPVVGDFLGDMLNPEIFTPQHAWYRPVLAPAAGNIGGSSGVPFPYPDAYPYH